MSVVAAYRIELDYLHVAKTVALVHTMAAGHPRELSHSVAVVHGGILVAAESPFLNRAATLVVRDNLDQMVRHLELESGDQENDRRTNLHCGCVRCANGCGPAFPSRSPVGIRPSVDSDTHCISALGGDFQPTGHAEWVDGRVHQTGFTTSYTPNTEVPHTDSGTIYDIDYTSCREDKPTSTCTSPTYAAVTSTSFHDGVVNVLLLDGSSRGVSNSIDSTIWNTLGARADGETIGEF